MQHDAIFLVDSDTCPYVEDFFLRARLWVPPHARRVLVGRSVRAARQAADHWNKSSPVGSSSTISCMRDRLLLALELHQER